MKRKHPEVVLLSGMSGSGKSEALTTLEDAGYFSVDNLPGALLPPLLDLLKARSGLRHLKRIALVMDAREKGFLKNFESYFRILKSRRMRLKILFFDARDDVLVRRFQETRRRHPLSPATGVLAGIQKERNLLHPLRNAATHIIDTSYLNVHELRDKVLFLLRKERLKREMTVSIVSFGYRFGLPLEADVVFDVRFFPNPHFVAPLRPLSGENPRVSGFILRQKVAGPFLRLLKAMLALLLKESLKEGKAYLTVAFGCTGGRHRSVAIAEQVAKNLKQLGYPVKIQHRDISRGG